MAKAKLPNPENYQNSAKKPKVESVVKGVVTAKNKTLASKIRGLFFARDLNELKEYVVDDIVIPGACKAAHGAVDMVFRKDVRSYTSNKGNTRIRYDRASNESLRYNRDETSRKKRDFRDLEFETRGDAEEVLSGLVDLIADYESASIADLYDLCDITSTFTDNKYGWTDLSDASVKRGSNGYYLVLPKAEQL